MLVVYFLGFFLLFFFGRGALPPAVARREAVTARVSASVINIGLGKCKNVL